MIAEKYGMLLHSQIQFPQAPNAKSLYHAVLKRRHLAQET